MYAAIFAWAMRHILPLLKSQFLLTLASFSNFEQKQGTATVRYDTNRKTVCQKQFKIWEYTLSQPFNCNTIKMDKNESKFYKKANF